MAVRIDFQALTAAGAVIQTFASRDLARLWWRDHAWEFPGCTVREVTVTTQERTIYRSRPQLRAVA